MSAVLGQGVEFDHRILEEVPVIDVVAATADIEQSALLAERDVHRRVGVRCRRLCLCVARRQVPVVVPLARSIADLIGERLEGEPVCGQVDGCPREFAVGVESAAVRLARELVVRHLPALCWAHRRVSKFDSHGILGPTC